MTKLSCGRNKASVLQIASKTLLWDPAECWGVRGKREREREGKNGSRFGGCYTNDKTNVPVSNLQKRMLPRNGLKVQKSLTTQTIQLVAKISQGERPQAPCDLHFHSTDNRTILRSPGNVRTSSPIKNGQSLWTADEKYKEMSSRAYQPN